MTDIYFVFGFVIYIASYIIRPQNRYKGKIWRFFARFRLGRKARDSGLWWWTFYMGAVFVCGTFAIFTGVNIGSAPFWFVVVCAVDDYFNGNDDGWKLWDTVRNKIKWKMDLPPAPAEEQVGS